jgi:hypothetical protein
VALSEQAKRHASGLPVAAGLPDDQEATTGDASSFVPTVTLAVAGEKVAPG